MDPSSNRFRRYEVSFRWPWRPRTYGEFPLTSVYKVANPHPPQQQMVSRWPRRPRTVAVAPVQLQGVNPAVIQDRREMFQGPSGMASIDIHKQRAMLRELYQSKMDEIQEIMKKDHAEMLARRAQYNKDESARIEAERLNQLALAKIAEERRIFEENEKKRRIAEKKEVMRIPEELWSPWMEDDNVSVQDILYYVYSLRGLDFEMKMEQAGISPEQVEPWMDSPDITVSDIIDIRRKRNEMLLEPPPSPTATIEGTESIEEEAEEDIGEEEEEEDTGEEEYMVDEEEEVVDPLTLKKRLVGIPERYWETWMNRDDVSPQQIRTYFREHYGRSIPEEEREYLPKEEEEEEEEVEEVEEEEEGYSDLVPAERLRKILEKRKRLEEERSFMRKRTPEYGSDDDDEKMGKDPTPSLWRF